MLVYWDILFLYDFSAAVALTSLFIVAYAVICHVSFKDKKMEKVEGEWLGRGEEVQQDVKEGK